MTSVNHQPPTFEQRFDLLFAAYRIFVPRGRSAVIRRSARGSIGWLDGAS